jgi:succinyl-diaminopimelate desuccinylase
VRKQLLKRIAEMQPTVAEICVELVRAPSENPPGDTRGIAEVAARRLRAVAGAQVDIISAEEPVANVVARLQGSGAGCRRRLIFNGHLDTFPVGDTSLWSVDPFGGVVRDGRIFGRGVTDMKAGLACSIAAFVLLADLRDAWSGELVLTLVGDEETMGRKGTEFLLNTYPEASGDAMICGDAGSPFVLRFGEKGLLWLTVEARGRAAHGAHVHLGDSAIDRLMQALEKLVQLRRQRVQTPLAIARAIARARRKSEAISGAGESRVLQSITVNIGSIAGGSSPNLVADYARAGVDIRLPVGVSIAQLKERINALLGSIPGISYEVRGAFEPNWTDPDHEIVRLTEQNGRAALGRRPVANMRVGASDSRFYRMRGIPTVVYGVTPHNMGAPDEHATLGDLFAVAQVHAMTAFDFLAKIGTDGSGRPEIK